MPREHVDDFRRVGWLRAGARRRKIRMETRREKIENVAASSCSIWCSYFRYMVVVRREGSYGIGSRRPRGSFLAYYCRRH